MGEFGERMGEQWGRFGEQMGEHWGDFGERTGERWGGFGERMGERWGEFGENIGESFAHGDFGDAGEAVEDLDWDWIGDVIAHAIETTLDAVDAVVESVEELPPTID